MVHESRLIQLFIHGPRISEKIRSDGHEKILPSLSRNHESRVKTKH